jgi:hypothetical protein
MLGLLAIFKIKDHKKDVAYKKFMDSCNFQVALWLPKKIICSNFKVFLEKDNQIKWMVWTHYLFEKGMMSIQVLG